jgi:hypothetical protein
MVNVSDGVGSVWADVLEVVRGLSDVRPPMEDYLVNGFLLVTPTQYRELVDAAAEHDGNRSRRWYESVLGGVVPEGPAPWTAGWMNPVSVWPSIPVLRVTGEPQDVGEGQVAVLGPDGAIYVFGKSLLDPPAPRAFSLFPEDRYPLL